MTHLPNQSDEAHQKTTYVSCVVLRASSENQQFLKDVTTSVLDGRGVGFLKQGRVKKLMEDENYRNFVVSRLNTALEKKLTDENQHLEDVVGGRHSTGVVVASLSYLLSC